MEQTIKITLPADAASPAQVEFSPGPLGKEAARLSEIPGSGWRRVSVGGAELDQFLVDRRLVTPKPLRKPRPDASDRMKRYNEAKKAPADPPAPAPVGVRHDPALGWDELEEAIEKKQNQKIGANAPDPKPENPYGLDDDFVF